MSMTRRLNDARASLTRAALYHIRESKKCERLLRELPENIDNVPAEVCASLLRSVGFAVLHRDHLEQVLVIVDATEGDDIDERARLSKLQAAMADELVRVRS